MCWILVGFIEGDVFVFLHCALVFWSMLCLYCGHVVFDFEFFGFVFDFEFFRIVFNFEFFFVQILNFFREKKNPEFFFLF